MEINIYVLCDGDWNEPEVQISGSSKDLSNFGLLLGELKDTIIIDTPAFKSAFYPVCVNKVSIQNTQFGGDRLTVTIDKTILKIAGTIIAFKKLSQSLVNFFNNETSIGEHFQIDYYEGNEILNKTNCHLIFMCDR